MILLRTSISCLTNCSCKHQDSCPESCESQDQSAQSLLPCVAKTETTTMLAVATIHPFTLTEVENMLFRGRGACLPCLASTVLLVNGQTPFFDRSLYAYQSLLGGFSVGQRCRDAMLNPSTGAPLLNTSQSCEIKAGCHEPPDRVAHTVGLRSGAESADSSTTTSHHST